MLRGLYTAAAGLITQQRKHDAVTNNIANLYTPGYKQVTAVSRSFPEMLIMLMGSDEGRARQIGRLNTGVMAEELLSIYLQGDLQPTNHPGDVALVSYIQVFEEVDGEERPIAFDASGKGYLANGEVIFQPQAFFTVWNADGEERYTRNGKFLVNGAGELVTTDGYRVIATNGQPITLDIPMDQLQITASGQLFNALTGEALLDDNGEPVALLISQIDNPYNLIREGHGVFRLDNAEENPARPVDNLADIAIYQGYVEGSNVDPTQAMVDMMAALRAYEANQKMIQFYDQSLDKAVNQVGRIV